MDDIEAGIGNKIPLWLLVCCKAANGMTNERPFYYI